jgi:sugar transferase (PEP-CTERM/EpsH1 system associated)
MGNEYRRIRIAHVIHQLEVGGLERVVINLMRNLDPERYRSSTYSLRAGGNLAGELEAAGIPVYSLGKRDGVDVPVFFRAAKLFRRENIDIVHCHNYGALLYGSIGGKLAGASGTVYTAHGTYSAKKLGQSRFGRYLPVNRIIAVSEDARKSILADGRIRPRDVETLPNGIDTGKFDLDVDVSEIKRELGLPDGARVLGIVARLSWEKDHKTLFDAMLRLKNKGLGAVLVVVGGGPLAKNLEKYVEDAGLADTVLFLGERSDVPRLLQVFDVFVLSSTMEGLSLTLLEAMAAGLPIVATDVGGNSEVVLDGDTGILIEPQNAAAMAAAMEMLLADDSLARKMGSRGRERVIELFSLEAMVKRYETIYEELLDAR